MSRESRQRPTRARTHARTLRYAHLLCPTHTPVRLALVSHMSAHMHARTPVPAPLPVPPTASPVSPSSHPWMHALHARACTFVQLHTCTTVCVCRPAFPADALAMNARPISPMPYPIPWPSSITCKHT